MGSDLKISAGHAHPSLPRRRTLSHAHKKKHAARHWQKLLQTLGKKRKTVSDHTSLSKGKKQKRLPTDGKKLSSADKKSAVPEKGKHFAYPPQRIKKRAVSPASHNSQPVTPANLSSAHPVSAKPPESVVFRNTAPPPAQKQSKATPAFFDEKFMAQNDYATLLQRLRNPQHVSKPNAPPENPKAQKPLLADSVFFGAPAAGLVLSGRTASAGGSNGINDTGRGAVSAVKGVVVKQRALDAKFRSVGVGMAGLKFGFSIFNVHQAYRRADEAALRGDETGRRVATNQARSGLLMAGSAVTDGVRVFARKNAAITQATARVNGGLYILDGALRIDRAVELGHANSISKQDQAARTWSGVEHGVLGAMQYVPHPAVSRAAYLINGAVAGGEQAANALTGKEHDFFASGYRYIGTGNIFSAIIRTSNELTHHFVPQIISTRRTVDRMLGKTPEQIDARSARFQQSADHAYNNNPYIRFEDRQVARLGEAVWHAMDKTGLHDPESRLSRALKFYHSFSELSAKLSSLVSMPMLRGSLR